MAGKDWFKTNRKNWQAAYQRWQERDALEWATSPRNPSVADHLYPYQQRVDHSKRGATSPLGGVATVEERANGGAKHRGG
jgi:hypothetical protein